MDKTANCIRMLQLLSTGRRFKISELADMLETNPRNVIEYRLELNKWEFITGCAVESKPGKDGGYYLEGNAMIPAAKLLPREKDVLVRGLDFLMAKPDFAEKDEALRTFSKIMSNLEIEERNLDFLVSVDKVKVRHDSKTRACYEQIRRAIKEKRRIEMTYDFLKSPRKTILADPYELFLYDNEWRFFGYSYDTGDIFYWKLSRIVDLKITDRNFRIPASFKREKYLRNGVFTQNGEMFELTLVAKGVRAKLFREKEFGANQTCVELPDGSVEVTMEMQKNPSTYNFLLGCGDLVKVVRPQWLIDKLKEIASTILAQYK